MPVIHFTPAECAALLHRLTVPDCIAEAIDFEDGMSEIAELSVAESEDMARQLTNYGHVVIDDATFPSKQQQARRAALVEALEGSTWVASHENADMSPQMIGAARRTLRTAARKVEAALGMAAGSITTPEA